jgi:hypothetical protein
LVWGAGAKLARFPDFPFPLLRGGGRRAVELGEQYAGENQRGSRKRSQTQALVKEREGSERREDGLERKHNRGVRGAGMLLRPHLHGKRDSRGQHAGLDQGCD